MTTPLPAENAALKAEVERLTQERDELHAEYERGIGRKVGHLEAVLHLNNLIVNNRFAKDWGEKVEQERDALRAENDLLKTNYLIVQEENAALRAESERLMQIATARWQTLQLRDEQINDAEAENARLRADAERYRWVRDCIDTTYDPECQETFVRFDALLGFNAWAGGKDERAIDVLIDAARSLE